VERPQHAFYGRLDNRAVPSTAGRLPFRPLLSLGGGTRKRGKEFVAGHLREEGYGSHWDRKPWGKTFGLHSPMYRAYQAGGKLLMLGVDYYTSTYVHLVEAMYWHTLRARNRDTEREPAFPALDRVKLGAFWESLGEPQHGQVGDAACRLFGIRSYVDTLLAEVERNPRPYLR